MNQDLAELLTQAATKGFGELSTVLPVLEEHLPAEEFTHWQSIIEQICDDIDQNITSKIYDQHPELREKAELRLTKYGVLF